MSSRLDQDLDLNLDNPLLEDEPDSAVSAWDDDLLDGFPADDPAAFDGLMIEKHQPTLSAKTAKVKLSGETAKPAKPAKTAKKGLAARSAKAKPPAKLNTKTTLAARRADRKKKAGFGISMSVGLLVVLGGVMLGAGVLLATGNAPSTMLDFSGLRNLSALSDLNQHPVNAFWVSLLVVLLSGGLAALGVQRRLKVLQEMLDAQGDLLAAVGALDPDVPGSWQQDVLLADDDLAAVTGNLLGHYQLQQAKLSRYVGLEGELHRLEMAMAENSQTELQGNWENPCAGSLADQALRLIADRNEQAKNASTQQQQLAAQGADLVSGLRNARIWHKTSHDQVNHLVAIIERTGRQLGKLAGNQSQDEDIARRRERLLQAVLAIRDELDALSAHGSAGRDMPEHGSMATLTERASRLAFQIAMEVARLGAKGERLLPLTRDLEELTTELRAKIDGSKTQSDEIDARDRFIETIRGRLVELDPDIIRMSFNPDSGKALNELAPQACESSAGLVKLSQSFGAQAIRLNQLIDQASGIVGLEVEEQDDLTLAKEGGMLVDHYDPFAPSSQPPGGLVADPFTGSSGSIFDISPAGDQTFSHQILPGEEDRLLSSSTPESAVLDVTSQKDQIVQKNAPGLSLQDDKIYDLMEFDAKLLPADSALDPPATRVYDLSEFDAVLIA